MPALSKKQRQLMAIAEHHPEEVSAKNKGVLKMSKSQLHDYASTSEKNLPVKKASQKIQAARKGN
jgi:hypothetical protein